MIGPDRSNWADKLAQEARILGESRMIRDEQEVTPELASMVVRRFQEFLQRTGKTAEWAARSMAISPPTLSQVCSGSYAASSEKHVRALDRWLEQKILAETAPKPAGFVKTRVAEKIYGLVSMCRKMGWMGLVHGPAGVGKTITLEAIRAETPGCVYVSLKTAKLRKLSVLETIAKAMRVDGVRLTAGQLFDHIEGQLRGTGRLILIDEVHKLQGSANDEALHVLRDLYDATGCPMVWAGVSTIDTYLRRGKANGYEPLAQINRRIKRRLNLTAIAHQTDGGPGLFSIDDVRKMFSSQKLRITPDGDRFLHKMANDPSFGPGVCEGLVALAFMAAGGEPITAELLSAIFEREWGVVYVDADGEVVQGRAAAAG